MKRRDFIRNVSCGAMGTTTLMSSLASLGAINGLAKHNDANAVGEDYKAMVCILLAGGMDSFNMLVPTGISAGSDNGFNEYKTLRSDLAFNASTDLRALTNPIVPGHKLTASAYNTFGVHPGMEGMQTLFNAGKLSYISNIGTLVEPIDTASQFYSNQKKIPLGVYSHSDQIMQWQTSVPQSRDALGVGGRMADILNANNTNNKVSMNISLAGKNIFQRGANISEYTISDNVDPNNVGIKAYPSWWGNSGLMNDLRYNAVDSLVSKTYGNLLEKTFSTTGKNSLEAFDSFKEALKKVPTINTSFASNSLANDLKAIAKVISVRQFLGVKRQIFFVTYGGWDMHDNLVNGLAGKLPVVSAALKAFYDATVELGVAENVTSFTISDFARTLTSNGQGSDHGWGGNNMVFGGAVNGRKILGAYPKMDVSASNTRNISFRGNYIPKVSTDEMYAELALWYGVSPSDLCYILPNIGNFYSYSPGNYPLGLMNFANSPINPVNHPLNCLTY